VAKFRQPRPAPAGVVNSDDYRECYLCKQAKH